MKNDKNGFLSRDRHFLVVADADFELICTYEISALSTAGGFPFHSYVHGVETVSHYWGGSWAPAWRRRAAISVLLGQERFR